MAEPITPRPNPQSYIPTLTSIDPDARQLLEERGIPPSAVLSHVQEIRDRAWAVYPYPCIGNFGFVCTLITKQPCYAEILHRLLSHPDQTLLDLGCGFGQEIRSLVSAGVSSNKLYGIDIVADFVNLGHDLFNDARSLRAHFLFADLLKDQVAALESRIDIVYAASFFHLFGWEDQATAAVKVVGMLRPVRGSLVFGHQMGYIRAGSQLMAAAPKGSAYLHDVESWRRLWEEVGRDLGIEFEVHAALEADGPVAEAMRRPDPGRRLLRFRIERV